MKDYQKNIILFFSVLLVTPVLIFGLNLSWHFAVALNRSSKITVPEKLKTIHLNKSRLLAPFPYEHADVTKIETANRDIWRLGRLSKFQPKVGMSIIPNINIREISKDKKGEVLFEAIYQFDEYGRRIHHSSNKQKNEFLFLFGGSYIMGTGLNSGQTLASQLSTFMPRHQVYNYSQEGAGTNLLLAQLQFSNIKTQVHQSKGIALYTFMHDHITRTVGDSFWMNINIFSPWYEIEKKKVIYKGLFSTDRKWKTLFYRAFGRSLFANILKLRIPDSTSRSSQNLTCQITLQAKKEFLSLYPQSRFIVLFHPLDANQEYINKYSSYTNCLVKNGVELFRPTFGNEPHSKLAIRLDGHPSAYANKLLAKYLATYIDQNNYKDKESE